MIEVVFILLVFVVGVCVGVVLREAQLQYETPPDSHHGVVGHPGLSRLFAMRDAETSHALKRLSLREYAKATGNYERYYLGRSSSTPTNG